jgi:putative nucleotidyltransferase with HDIG domain
MGLYAGRWIAMVRDQVVGQGGTPEQARLAARVSRPKESSRIFYVPTTNPLEFPPVLQKVTAALPTDLPVYLVGGAVRDALLCRKIHDLDFVLPSNAVKISRQIADRLKAAFFPLDDIEHDTGRVILISEDGSRFTLDFAARRGPDLESDLRARDFTCNALAVDVRQPQFVLDPLGGAADLLAKQLRPCSPTSFSDDPVRVLRAIRQAAGFRFHIPSETRSLMRSAVPLLPNVSAERMRDELFRLLDGPRVSAAIRALDMLGALQFILPEMDALKGIEQSPPHYEDVWNHTLSVIHQLDAVLAALAPAYDPESAASLPMAIMVLRLGRYRHKLDEHFKEQLNADRPLRPLLFLAALYHDAGKPETRTQDSDGKYHFYGHDESGARIIERRATSLRLSNLEIERARKIVRGHLRPVLLEKDGILPTKRAVYRFYRDMGVAGIDICILALADFLGSYGLDLLPEKWEYHLEVIHSLMEAWWEHPRERVTPAGLVNGYDVMKELKIPAGPQVGKLLEAIREAQATGQIATRSDAFDLARKMLAEEAKSN